MSPTSSNRLAAAGHLVRRFAGSLDPRPVSVADDEWAVARLLPGEIELWRRLSTADRRHAVGVARRVADSLDGAATRPVLAAALLHDVGKVVSGYGTVRRVLATLAAAVAGRDRLVDRPGSRLSQYLTHDAIGAGLLADGGSDPLTVAWAREHHLPPHEWSVELRFAHALKDADDD